MTILVAGSAALYDLLLVADGQPGTSDVGRLDRSPGASGRWLPGGGALTIALAMRRQGCDVALWHPLPEAGSEAGLEAALLPLRRAGIDLSRVPWHRGDAARCVIVQAGEQRLAWSSDGPDAVIDAPDRILDGVTHVVIAPRWGNWTDRLVQAAAGRGIAVSLIGEPAPRLAAHRWHCVVLDDRQMARVGDFQADIAVTTHGAAGATVREGGEAATVAAVRASVIDTTGAGDVFGATFLACRLEGRTPAAAGHEAAVMAARTCEGWGAWTALEPLPTATQGAGRDARVRGALAGLACGDAFGMPNSFMADPPWLTRMMPGPSASPYHAGYPAGRITDDTEQALALTQALEDGFSAASVANRLCEWFVAVGGENSLAVGPSTKRAMIAFQAGLPLSNIGRGGVTNGAAMRIAPIGIHAGLQGLALEALVDLVETACLPTHFTGPAIAGASAVAAAVAAGINGSPWEEVMAEAVRGARAGVRRGQWVYAADVAERILWACRMAATAGSTTELAQLMSDVVGAGEPSTEAVPAALAIADYAAGDPALAIGIAGNLRGDTDTIAAMAGAVCGAYAGMSALPEAWIALVATVNRLDIPGWAGRLQSLAR